MAQSILLKRSSVAGNVPGSSDLSLGEIAINTADGAVYIKKGNNDIVAVHDNDILHIDTTNSRIGIGTTSPGYRLHVDSGTNDWPALFKSTDAKAGIVIQDTNTVNYLISQSYTLSIGNQASLHANNLNIKSTGNVGIGATAPSQKLDVRGGNIMVGGYGGGTDYGMLFTPADSASYWHIYNDTGGELVFGRNITIGSTEHARFDNNGNFGIGTSSPQRTFHVNSGTTNVVARLESTDGIAAIEFKDSAGSAEVGNSGNDVVFFPGGIEKARITSHGNLRFTGQTTNFESAGFTYHTNNYLYLRGGSAGLILADDSNANTVQIIDGASGYINFETGDGTSRMRIKHTGKVGIGEISPETELHVKGTNNSAGDQYTQVGPGNTPSITIQNAGTTDNNNAALYFRDNDGMRASVGARFINHTTNEAELRFSTTDSSGNTRERLTLKGSGALRINNAYTLPTADGSANQVLKTDGSGNITFATVAGASGGTSVSDSDGDTKIQVEESSDEDIIRFDIAGTEKIVLDTSNFDIESGGFRVNDSGNNYPFAITQYGYMTSRGASITQLNATGDHANVPLSVLADVNTTRTASYVEIGNIGAAGNKFKIDSAGNVGVGVTSVPSWANLMTNGTVAVGGILYMKTGNAIQALSNFPGGASDLKMQTSGGKVTIGGPGGSTTGHLELYGRYSGNDPKLSFRSDHPTSGNTTVWDMARITADDGGNYNGVLHFQVAAGTGGANNAAALATAMTIQDTKYVGIGTTSPGSLLHVYDGNIELQSPSGSGGRYISFNNTHTGGRDYRLISTNDSHGSLGGGDFAILDNNVSGNDAAKTRLLIDSSGNVGIGTTTPSAKLEILSDGSAAGGAEIRLQHANNNTNDVVSTINFANNAGSVAMIQGGTAGANNTGYISFFTDNAGTSAEHMRIDGNGSLFISSTSDSGSNRHFFQHDGFFRHVRSGQIVGVFDRLSTDGNIVHFRKDGADVGAIGTVDADLTIFSTASGHKGLRFGNGYIAPTGNSTAVENGTTDLGLSTQKFKDLHLSGNANIDGEIYAKDANSATDPTYAFTGHTDTGMGMYHSNSQDQLSLITDGVQRAYFNTAGITSFANVYTSSTGAFRNYGGVWHGTTGLANNGFYFLNTANSNTTKAMDLSHDGNVVFAGEVEGASLDINGVADISGNLTVGGNLTVNGTTTTLNTTTLDVEDLNITVAKGATNSAGANGAGLTVDCGSDTDTTFTYNGSSGQWETNTELVIKPRHTGGTPPTLTLGDLNNQYQSGIASSGHLTMRASGSGNQYWQNDNTYLMMLTSGGDLSIGNSTTAPTNHRVHIKTAVDDSVSQGLVIERSNNTDRGYINYQGGGFQFRSTVGDPIVFGETDHEHMRIQPDGNIGIDNTSPAEKFTIGSAASKGDIGFHIGGHRLITFGYMTTNSSETTVAGFPAEIRHDPTNGLLRFGIDGTTRSVGDSSSVATALTIKTGGNVGIGTASPGEKLEVVGNVESEGLKLNVNTSMYTQNASLSYYSSTNAVYLNGAGNNGWLRLNASGTQNSRNSIDLFGSGAGDYVKVKAGNTDTMYIGSNGAGRVGIGTSTPQHILDTVGTIRHTSNIVSNTVYKAFTIGSNRTINDYGGLNKDYWAIQLATPGANTDGQSSAHAYGALKFSGVSAADTTLDDVLVLNYNGNVGIGTTAPAEKLDVYGGNIQVGKATVNGDRYEVKVIGYDASQAYNVSLKTEYDGVYGRAGQIVTNDVSRFEINTTQSNASILLHPGTGNVGIGLDSPNAKLQVEEYGIDTTSTASSATTQIAIHSFAAATFRSARFTVQVTNSTDSTYHTTELLLVHDGSTANITEFGEIHTGSAREATFDADINSGNVRLLATPASTDTMAFKVVCHSITV